MTNTTNIKIGITERGDAACDLSWITKCEKALSDGSLNGAVIITKNLNTAVTDAILNLHRKGFPPHCPCYHHRLGRHETGTLPTTLATALLGTAPAGK